MKTTIYLRRNVFTEYWTPLYVYLDLRKKGYTTTDALRMAKEN